MSNTPGPGHAVLKALRYGVTTCGESTGPLFPPIPEDPDEPEPDDDDWMHAGAARMLCPWCDPDAGLMPADAGSQGALQQIASR